MWIARIIFLIICTALWHTFHFLLPTNDIVNNTIIDRLHDLDIFISINDYLYENKVVLQYNLILASMLININILFVSSKYVFYGNGKIVFILAVGLLLKELCQLINVLTPPENMLSLDADLTSFLHMYEITGNLIFSGHTFFAVYTGLEIMTSKNILIKTYALLFMLYEIFFMIAVNGHYFIAIYTAISTYFMLNYFYDKLIMSGSNFLLNHIVYRLMHAKKID